MAVFRVEKNKNYTVMSNHHLKDKNLTLKSKGLLSLILSLPDEWNYTTRGLATICKEGVDCIGSALKELDTSGYIKRNQIRDERGRIKDTEYVIYENPQDSYNIEPEIIKPETDSPCTEKPYMDKPYMVEPYMENPAQLNTNSIKEKINKNTDLLSNHQSIAETSDDEIDRYDYYKQIIKKNIDYEFLVKRQDSKMVDEIVDIMFDFIAIHRINTRIAGVMSSQ
jgi:hypothetical protein